jgi:type I restriction enzyme M protein
MERFEALSKVLFTKIVDEREAAGLWNGSPAKEGEELVPGPGDGDRILYERARSIWNRAVSAYPKVFAGDRGRFPGDVAAVGRILRLLGDIDLTGTSADVKGPVYEELLRNTFEKNENQQYFTPRQVVEFMVAVCEPRLGERVCDPAAGSGGFLVGSLLWMAEHDASGGEPALTGADVDKRMAWVARINILMHGGDPRAVHHLDKAGALSAPKRLRNVLPGASYDLILTNPPFGSDLADPPALASFALGEGRSSRRRGALFVERCLDLLKPGGRLAIVLDDSVLNLPSNDDVRQLIRRRAVVEAVFSLPEVTFMPYSTAKSSILVLRRKANPAEQQGPVFMADLEQVGNRPNGDPLYSDEVDEDGNRRLLSDLPGALEAYRRFRHGSRFRPRAGEPTVFVADLDRYAEDPNSSRLDVFFHHPARSQAQTRLRQSSFPLRSLDEVVELDASASSPAREYGDSNIRWVGLAEIEAETGRFEVAQIPGDRIRSNAHRFQGGDVLFSRLRPKLRKVVLVPEDDEGGFCSSELLVMRPGPDAPILPELLAYLLRSDLTYGQLIYQITGVGRPRVGARAVRQLKLPVPPAAEQQRLLRQLVSADQRAERLRAESRRQLTEATALVGAAFDGVLEALIDHSGRT